MNIYEKAQKLAELLGWRCIKIDYASCGGAVFEYIWVKGEHTLQTADWYARDYSSYPDYWMRYDALLDAEREAGIVAEPQSFTDRKRKRIWLGYWIINHIEPLHAQLERRLDALIYALAKLPLTNH